MLQDPKRLFTLFGFLVWGDFGPLTMYRSKRGKIVAFAKTWPLKPASPKQAELRQKFKEASHEWNQLTDEQREQWELATKRLSMPMHGYDLYMHWQLQPNDSYVRTIQRQSKTDLIP